MPHTRSRSLIVVLTNATGKELDRREVKDGVAAVKIALLMLAKRDALAAGDTLQVLAPN